MTNLPFGTSKQLSICRIINLLFINSICLVFFSLEIQEASSVHRNPEVLFSHHVLTLFEASGLKEVPAWKYNAKTKVPKWRSHNMLIKFSKFYILMHHIFLYKFINKKSKPLRKHFLLCNCQVLQVVSVN